MLEAMDADDAMGSFDPWGTGKYKGIDLNATAATAATAGSGAHEEDKDGGGAPVAFKKRKGPAKGKFRKKPREADD
ncbi:unnamed protein product [Choristocarpus tenellus]